jgi:hypothetical protein
MPVKGKKMNIAKPETRKWIYSIIAATVPMLVLLGYVTNDAAAGIMNIVAAVLAMGGSSLAYVNVPSTEEDSLSE